MLYIACNVLYIIWVAHTLSDIKQRVDLLVCIGHKPNTKDQTHLM